MTERPGFAALLRQILVEEQHRKLKDVAAQLGMSARNFYGRVTGRIQFTPAEINRLLRAVPDPRLVDWLLAQTPLACAPRAVAPPPSGPTRDIALHAVEAAMATLRGVLDLPGTDPAQTLAHLHEAQRQLAALEHALHAAEEPVAA